MSVDYHQCSCCQNALFPPRICCFNCGSQEFETRTLDRATVLEFTESHRGPVDWPYKFLVEIQAENAKLKFLAVSDFPPVLGELVHVSVTDAGLTYIERK